MRRVRDGEGELRGLQRRRRGLLAKVSPVLDRLEHESGFWIAKSLRSGMQIVLSGKIDQYLGRGRLKAGKQRENRGDQAGAERGRQETVGTHDGRLSRPASGAG